MNRPLMLLDIDGPLNPFLAPAHLPGYRRLRAGHADWLLAPEHGDWIRHLARSCDLMWASTWEEEANTLAGRFYGLPDLPWISFAHAYAGPDETAKLPEVVATAAARPLVWLDDDVHDDARTWVANRAAPSLLVECDPRTGWNTDQYAQVRCFLAALPTRPHS